jgi:hypothetical protein
MNYLEKRKKLPENIKEFLSSSESHWEIEKSFFMFGLDESYLKYVVEPIGLIFIRETNLKDYPQIIAKKLVCESNIIYGLAFEINKRIFNRFPEYFEDSETLLNDWASKKINPIISEEEAWKKVLEIEPWILEEQKEKEEEEKQSKDNNIYYPTIDSKKYVFSEALKKFLELGEQLITSSKIRLKSFPESVRPSIKNWLSDYTFNAGYERRDSMALGNYLYQNENAKTLNAYDRQRLAYILKAFDENSEVTINEKTKQIAFPEMRNVKPRKVAPLPRGEHETPKDILFKPRVNTPIQSNQSGFFSGRQSNLTFSSPHKLPAESMNNRQGTMINEQRTMINKQGSENNTAPARPLIITPGRKYTKPVPDYNVVNLKEKK